MRGKLAARAASAKTGHCRIRQSKHRIRQSISPVMQKVRDLLPAVKPASHLHILTAQPVSTCEKLLCGQRAENAEALTALLRSDLGREVLFALMGEARPDWFVKYRKQLMVNDARRQIAETQRTIEMMQREASE